MSETPNYAEPWICTIFVQILTLQRVVCVIYQNHPIHQIHQKINRSESLNFPQLSSIFNGEFGQLTLSSYICICTLMFVSVVVSAVVFFPFHFVEQQPQWENMCRKLQFMQHFAHTWKAPLF